MVKIYSTDTWIKTITVFFWIPLFHTHEIFLRITNSLSKVIVGLQKNIFLEEIISYVQFISFSTNLSWYYWWISVRGGQLKFLTNWYERRKKTHQLSRNRTKNDELNIVTESWILAGSRLQRIGQVSQPKEGVTVDFASRRSADDDRQLDDVFVKLETRTLNNMIQNTLYMQ